MHACVRVCVRACVRACMHACVHACVRACMHACVRASVCACVRACVCVCVPPHLIRAWGRSRLMNIQPPICIANGVSMNYCAQSNTQNHFWACLITDSGS